MSTFSFCNKTFVVLLFLCLSINNVCSQVPDSAIKWNGDKEKYTSGIGTKNDPFILEQPSQLAYLSDGGEYKGKYFKVVNDFDMAFIPWTPIAPFETSCFQGKIDFDGHTIYNLSVEKSSGAVGLFGYVKNADISNIKFSKTCKVSGTDLTGMLVACAENTSIRQVFTEGEVYSCSLLPKTGGVVGYAINTHCQDIINGAVVVNDGTGISGNEPLLNVGGIIGSGIDCEILRCGNSGMIKAYAPHNLTIGEVGGILGSSDNCLISYSFNKGDVYCNLRYVRSGNNGTKSFVAGIVGGTNGATVVGCYNVGHIYGTSYWNGKYACIMSCHDSSVNPQYKPLVNCFSTWMITGCEATSYTCKDNRFNGIQVTVDEINSSYIVGKMNDGTSSFVKDEYPYVNGGLPFFSTILAKNIRTEDATVLSAQSAELFGSAFFTGYKVIAYLFRIKGKGESEWIEYKSLSKNLLLDNLEPDKTYDFVFGMQISDGSCFWSENTTSFKTLPIYSEVFTLGVRDITEHSAVINGAVVMDENEELISYGFVLKSLNAEETVYVSDNKKDEYYSVVIDGLEPETQYCVVAFAETDLGVVYGDEVIFSTLPATANGISKLFEGGEVTIYTLNGVKVYSGEIGNMDLGYGVYILKKGSRYYKIVI